MLEHVGNFLSVPSLVEKVKLERHVPFSFFYQPHEGKVWKEPMNHLQKELHTHTHRYLNPFFLIYRTHDFTEHQNSRNTKQNLEFSALCVVMFRWIFLITTKE